ncbi:MAG: hypothetical protein A9957_09485 [Methanohalophilus sp. DAL1]|nr:MAG: hypothetical protein A9957_09485 [Methanohalophilus sp. DAL1]
MIQNRILTRTFRSSTPSAFTINVLDPFGISTSLMRYLYSPPFTGTVLVNSTLALTESAEDVPLIVIVSPTVGFEGDTSKAEAVEIPSIKAINSNNIHLCNRFNGDTFY